MTRLKFALGALLILYFLIAAYGDYVERRRVDMAGALCVVGATVCAMWSTWRNA